MDLRTDPPPDLIIEVDVTSSSIPRMPIFAAMSVPEVWRLQGTTLHFLHLQPNGTYQPRDVSRNLPGLTLATVQSFLQQGRTLNKSAWNRAFREFVREHLIPRPPAEPDHPDHP